jgi:hypothetical protein
MSAAGTAIFLISARRDLGTIGANDYRINQNDGEKEDKNPSNGYSG